MIHVLRPDLQFPLDTTLSRAAGRDFVAVIDWSTLHFGREAADRYEALIRQALTDLGNDPFRSGVIQRPTLPPDLFLYPIAASRNRVSGDRVKAARHIVLYRIQKRSVLILRILHESRDLKRHYPA